jgi:hypothetical protein
MSNICNFCNDVFTRKDNLTRHLRQKRCKSILLNDLTKLNNVINSPIINENNTINERLSINNINLFYVKEDKMKGLIETYDKDKSRLAELLSCYIRDIICNKHHPENHCIKYINKRNMIFNIVINEGTEVERGNIQKSKTDKYNIICDIASKYMFKYILKNLKRCLVFYRKDEDFQDLYEDTVIQIKQDLDINVIVRALKLCLKNYILQDTSMKLK